MSVPAHHPVVIVGAGPSGASASMHLSKLRIPHCLIDRSEFPRDKICGDAISGKVSSLLRALDPNWLMQLNDAEFSMPSWGVSFSSPSGIRADIPFNKKGSEHELSAGYIVKRKEFDRFLIDRINPDYCTFMGSCTLQSMSRSNGKVVLETSRGHMICDWVLSAEGSRSKIAKEWGGLRLDRRHHCGGMRVYYDGVEGLSTEGYIELHFVPEALPGYVWIFPLPNGQANIGIGMLSKDISARKVDLKKMLKMVLEGPRFRDRFKNATPLEQPRGWDLPLGSKKRSIQGNGFLLLGDAAALIDPFTGEGIGNGMISGRIAAECLAEAWDGNGFASEKVLEYQDRVYAKLWGELRLSALLQKLVRFPWLFNLVMKRLRDNNELRETVMFMFENVDLRKKFSKPSFYIRLLLGR